MLDGSAETGWGVDLNLETEGEGEGKSVQAGALEVVQVKNVGGRLLGAIGAEGVGFVDEERREEEYEEEQVVKVYPEVEDEEDEVSEYEYVEEEDGEAEEEVTIPKVVEQAKEFVETKKEEIFSDSEITQTTEGVNTLSEEGETSRPESVTSVEDEVELPAQKMTTTTGQDESSPSNTPTTDLHEVDHSDRFEEESTPLAVQDTQEAQAGKKDDQAPKLSVDDMSPVMRALWIFAGILQTLWIKTMAFFGASSGRPEESEPVEQVVDRVEEIVVEEQQEEHEDTSSIKTQEADENTPLLSGVSSKFPLAGERIGLIFVSTDTIGYYQSQHDRKPKNTLHQTLPLNNPIRLLYGNRKRPSCR